jgi:hypothetical protein
LAAENEDLRRQIDELRNEVRTAAKKPSKGKREPDEETKVDEEDSAASDQADEKDGEGEDEDAGDREPSPFQDWEAEDLKNWIAEAQGSRPKGNPNHETLVRMADELNADLAKKNEGK